MTHLCPITPRVGGWSLPGPSPGLARALQTAWSPGGEGSRLQDGSTGSGRGYEALAIKFKLHIRHTLPRADSRHQLLVFSLEKPFLTGTGGEAGARRAPAAPAAPRPSPKGQRQQPSEHFPPSPSPHGGKGSEQFAPLLQRRPEEALPTPSHGVRATPALRIAPPHRPASVGPHVRQRRFRNFKKKKINSTFGDCLCVLLSQAESGFLKKPSSSASRSSSL